MLKVIVILLLLAVLFGGRRRELRGPFIGVFSFLVGVGILRIVLRVVAAVFLLAMLGLLMWI